MKSSPRRRQTESEDGGTHNVRLAGQDRRHRIASQHGGGRRVSQDAPEGVSLHVARLGRPQGTTQQLGADVVLQTNQDLPRAAESLVELKLDAVVFAHTSGSMLGGPAYEEELVSMLEHTVGCPAVTTASAVVAAGRASGTTRLALLAPYPEPMTLAEKDFLEEVVTGLKIVSHRSLAMSTGLAIWSLRWLTANPAKWIPRRQTRCFSAGPTGGPSTSSKSWRPI